MVVTCQNFNIEKMSENVFDDRLSDQGFSTALQQHLSLTTKYAVEHQRG